MLPMEQAALYRLEESSLLLRVPFNFPPFFTIPLFVSLFAPLSLLFIPQPLFSTPSVGTQSHPQGARRWREVSMTGAQQRGKRGVAAA
jgi:hypothetical protein